MGGTDLDRRSRTEFGIGMCQVDMLNRQLASSLYFQGRFGWSCKRGCHQHIDHIESHEIVFLKPFSNSAYDSVYIKLNPNQCLLCTKCWKYECA